MRNPNGYGSVVKLSGNRRKPFVVRKTNGFNEKGHPIYEILGYYATRKEAMMVLAEYNRNPYDINTSKITLKQLFEKWLERDKNKVSNSTLRSHQTSFKHAKELHDLAYKDIKAWQMQKVVDDCKLSYSTQGHIKSFFKQMDRLALELDIPSKGYSSLITTAPVEESSKKPFTKKEVAKAWEYKDQKDVSILLIMLYTGFRISELLKMKVEDIDLQEMTFKGGIKTKASKNRIVPIHSKIQPYVIKMVESGHLYPFSKTDREITLSTFYKTVWYPLMDLLEMEHTPHECRHTFRTMLDNVDANNRCINLLMGHTSKDIGERVYTHKTLEDLRKTIELLP